MPAPSAPTSLSVQQADGNILVNWTASSGATAYLVQRSTDGVTFSALATTAVVTQYLDSLPGTGIMYWYQIAARNGSGDSSYAAAGQMVAAPPAEMSLYEIRLRAQQRADRVGSTFVTLEEWNNFVRISLYELYDLLITSYEDYFAAQYVYITTNGTTQNYPLPNGASNYYGSTYPSTGTTLPAQAFYKLAGVDLGVNTSNNAWVTLKKYNFIERNKYIYPNSTSTIYGVYNMAYRMMGTNINIIPTPSGNQQLRLWYSPRLPALLQDVDLSTIGYSGWLEYPIVRAARYALAKEEGADLSAFDNELLFLKARIESAASNRDNAIPDTISATRQDPVFGGNGFAGGGSSSAGW